VALGVRRHGETEPAEPSSILVDQVQAPSACVKGDGRRLATSWSAQATLRLQMSVASP